MTSTIANDVQYALQRLILKRQPFSSEDIRRQLSSIAASSLRLRPCVLGQAISSAARSGQIRPVGFTRALHEKARGRMILTWLATR